MASWPGLLNWLCLDLWSRCLLLFCGQSPPPSPVPASRPRYPRLLLPSVSELSSVTPAKPFGQQAVPRAQGRAGGSQSVFSLSPFLYKNQ